jgi:hypothetical protein
MSAFAAIRTVFAQAVWPASARAAMASTGLGTISITMTTTTMLTRAGMD